MDKNMIRRSYPTLVVLGVSAVLIVGIAWWLGGGSSLPVAGEVELTSDEQLTAPLAPEQLEAYDVDKTSDMNPVAVLETNKGTIEIELFEDTMPITAGNFKKLINEGFYDGIKFHRVIEGFMIQGGDPITKTDEVMRYGTGDPGYAIPDEHVVGDKMSNVRGSISMANSGPNSGGSQFFINLVDNTNLDFDKQPLSSKHPVFGQIVAGMDVVDAIGGVDVTPGSNLPIEPIIIEKATVREG